MEKFLTVKDAAALVGKSESTIKRLIHDVVQTEGHPDRESIQPSVNELAAKRAAGELYAWRIEREFLLQRLPKEPEQKPKTRKVDSPIDELSSPLIEVLREQLQSKDRQIETLEKQLDRKDEQIGNQNERMREQNILMKELQQRLSIAAPASPAEVVMEPKQGTDRSRSFWLREFHLFGRSRS
ncbi:MAG: hypothetical protein R3C18_13990 [Planctomycetaceae bacterium]